MRIWILSDLHLEFASLPKSFAVPKADVCVCAGDVLPKGIVPSIDWLVQTISDAMPIVMVAGNHEFYKASFEDSLQAARSHAKLQKNFHLLDNDVADIGGVRFLGGTLWTDFKVLSYDPGLSMAAAERGMNDYKRIKFRKQPYMRFKPIHSFRKHLETRRFIETALSEFGSAKTVVVTHHAPSPKSIEPGDEADILSACYASDLEDVIYADGPELWIHGHIHHRRDYMVGKTRVLANPRGYPGERTFAEFDSAFVIEI
ncbi:putative phosphoesterase, ICC [Rhizobium leguminosarum bv. trifolii WSM2297]|uniref:Putative phosphoesterase, ICC n=1 Tax=Rhizobium leguminosarum bv. trifolii WSM2297 TaxID=754762 RepID=J0CBZ0_RHILT|nr:metallophosphoesterase [Rhizobium leguminosarum]EJC80667.1 putative phosphoesterase, ICC [Rhizobium leguminosarum bv. trifolii WSM2297]